MIADLKPYPAMKKSGVPWLGDVPENWKIQRAKTLFFLVDVRSKSGSEELLTVSSNHGVVPRRTANVTMFKAESYAGHKLCWPGDLVINSLWAWARGLGVSEHHGIVSTAYGVYRPQSANTLDPRFVHELVRSSPFHWELRVRSKGVWTSRLQLTDDSFLSAPFPIPPLTEQAAIVRFLDHADRRIRRYIRAKQKLIKLLEEQKQAIIHRAVTRGLDPNVRLKPSGVEWLGEVPEHWEVRCFPRCAIERADYRGATPTKTESGVFLVTAKNIRKGWIDYETSREFVSEHDYAKIMQRGLPRAGDLLLTTEAPLGHAARVDREDIALAQRVIRFRMRPDTLDSEFALHAVLSPYFQHQLLQRGTGSTAIGIKASKLPQLQVLCPPLLEQKAITRYVEVECASPSRAIDRARAEVELLREYRTRLIADVVTGKLDVREAAANLPDEPDRSELEHETLDDEVSEDSAEELELTHDRTDA
jgi:type I restriction enzyme S subunit